YKQVLGYLADHGRTFGDLVLHVSKGENHMGKERYWGFFSVEGCVEEVLSAWASSQNSATGRKCVHQWAVAYVQQRVQSEGDYATRSKLLHTSSMDLDADFAKDFSMPALHSRIRELCPTMLSILNAFSTTAKQTNTMKPSTRVWKDNVPAQALIALGARSQQNSYAHHILGLYAYASGAQRQVISVMSQLGLTISYPMLAGRDKSRTEDASTVPEDTTKTRQSQGLGSAAVGLLKRLSNACRSRSREAALMNLLAYVYDNINMLFKVAEQVVGRKDTQQNGTCATTFKLYDASLADMQMSDLLASLVDAPPLSVNDILLLATENAALTDCLTHTVLRIIVTYGGERFARFQDEVAASLPNTPDKIPVHKTEIFPLPAMHIDESSTTGNADVLGEIFSVMMYSQLVPLMYRSTLKITAGDQLSISRIRSPVANRAGHDSFGQSFLWALCMPGLFHYKMTATHAVLESHFGSASTSNPGSLADRKPIVLSSLPPFCTCRDLIFVSLYARILHCLQLVSDCDSLDEYAANISFSELQQHAEAIVNKYAAAGVVHEQRSSRDAEKRRRAHDVETESSESTHEPQPSAAGDMVFENAVLFLRDALVLREFNDTIKVGDSGRIVTVLKIWALVFRGSGRMKYAHELLHLIHNLTHVWPEPLRRIVLKNWLLNPTGKDDSWVEVDLLQEHLNFWIKNIYQAHRSNASWEWLGTISPCIDILHRLATQINHDLGSRQGAKHTSPSVERDISELMDALAQHRVYEVEPGRVIDTEKPVIPNASSAGLAQLAGPLADFNAQIKRLQARCRLTPV
ncbi:hypothetical protein PYCCODRAFT_1354209, partial [Trametes coccinea BRFM310]